MDSRENLRAVVNAIIKSDMETATTELNSYLETKSAEIVERVTTNSDWEADNTGNDE